MSTETVGVLLLNLGGPDNLDAVRPFLQNLFSDREIIELPGGPWLQPAFARLIARVRTRTVQEYYRLIGGGSPLLRLTEQQAKALQDRLAATSVTHRFVVGVAMRYWNPSSHEALAAMQRAGVRRIVALTLYPQYSKASTQSSVNELKRQAHALGLEDGPAADRMRLTVIDRYPRHPAYVTAIVGTILLGLNEFPETIRNRVTLLFSAHGLPQRMVDGGDPYVEEIGQTRQAVLDRLREFGVANPWKYGFQSRVGPVKWIRPYTDEVIEQLGKEGVREVLVVPISFVSDHIETLYEIDILYGKLARKCGIAEFRRVRSLNDDPAFISALADLVQTHLRETGYGTEAPGEMAGRS
ncbi:MAG: ferrochelatase [Planctomycetes bacterium]|nr:ferrochelatase [Planctomycetota bacterium]